MIKGYLPFTLDKFLFFALADGEAFLAADATIAPAACLL
jgi:hypothetical protein